MTRYVQWIGFLISLSGLLPACQQVRRMTGHLYQKTTTAVTNADLIGGTEIDTGRYVLLAYEQYSDRPHHSDSWFAKNVFIKVRSLDEFPLQREVVIPRPGVSISTYSRATWYFEASKVVAGTITRLASSAAGYRLRLNLRYTDAKGKSLPLLAGTVFFRNDSTYFQRHQVDYHGKYDDLRLALKEPAKVKSLDLVTYAIQYEKRNGRDSGPDTLYQRLGELYNLEELNVILSHLKALPLGMRHLKRLKKLNLGYNNLTVFPTMLFALDSLQELNLEYNHLDSIPATVSQLRQLKVLNLNDNRLNRYPMAVNEIVGLQELSLANANLRAVPIQIQQLTDLRVLNLDGFWNNKRRNQLQDISALGGLKQLRSLSIESNATIESIPSALYQLQNLEELKLNGNLLDSSKVNASRWPKLKKLTW